MFSLLLPSSCLLKVSFGANLHSPRTACLCSSLVVSACLLVSLAQPIHDAACICMQATANNYLLLCMLNKLLLPSGCSALQKAVNQAGTYTPGTLQQLQSLAACINANAHASGHQEDTNSETGLGMYPILSMFNHSCDPNLAHSSTGESRPLKHAYVLCPRSACA